MLILGEQLKNNRGIICTPVEMKAADGAPKAKPFE